jgi:RNA polymerase sigma factor (sigma-70 family)
MPQMPSNDWTIIEQDLLISQAMERDQPRLRSFIRKHVADTGEAEDILQEVFYELIQAYRLMKPVEHVTAWLFRVARNRMIDLFRKNKPDSLSDPISSADDGDTVPKRPMPEACSSTRWKRPWKSFPRRKERSS